MEKVELQTGQFYHLFNRGTDKRTVFECKKDFLRFILGMKILNTTENINMSMLLKTKKADDFLGPTLKNLEVEPGKSKLVTVVCYCLLPNHFHIILRQEVDGGISKFMQKLITAYVMYFNKKNERSGGLFQGKYKKIHIKSDDQLLQTSLYVNGNSEIHRIGKIADWKYSSCLDYLDLREEDLCDKDVILKDCKKGEYSDLLKVVIRDTQQRKYEAKFLDI